MKVFGHRLSFLSLAVQSLLKQANAGKRKEPRMLVSLARMMKSIVQWFITPEHRPRMNDTDTIAVAKLVLKLQSPAQARVAILSFNQHDAFAFVVDHCGGDVTRALYLMDTLGDELALNFRKFDANGNPTAPMQAEHQWIVSGIFDQAERQGRNIV